MSALPNGTGCSLYGVRRSVRRAKPAGRPQGPAAPIDLQVPRENQRGANRGYHDPQASWRRRERGAIPERPHGKCDEASARNKKRDCGVWSELTHPGGKTAQTARSPSWRSSRSHGAGLGRTRGSTNGSREARDQFAAREPPAEIHQRDLSAGPTGADGECSSPLCQELSLELIGLASR